MATQLQSELGMAIVVLTLVINMLLFPLRISSYRTTLKMQRVAPEIKQIQEKYKKYSMRDPRKAEMNKEVMAVLQPRKNQSGRRMLPDVFADAHLVRAEHGAAFLRSRCGMRGGLAGSATCPLKILIIFWPITMGLSMYLVSKMTPMTTTDRSSR